jgi:hypothetical protein
VSKHIVGHISRRKLKRKMAKSCSTAGRQKVRRCQKSRQITVYIKRGRSYRWRKPSYAQILHDLKIRQAAA